MADDLDPSNAPYTSTSTTRTATPSNSPPDAAKTLLVPGMDPVNPSTSKYRFKKKKVVLQDQSSTELSTLTKSIIFCGLGLSLFLSFLDSTSVATAAPMIAKELGAGQSISWVGTSYLVANTSCQLIYGRLSDIFGRKALLIGALIIFAIGDLLCGFAQTPVQLYVFRAVAGIGGGGINNMAMIIMSDVTTLRERGKWQGFNACAVALGSAVGPFVGAVFSQKVTWRWTFWCTPPLTLLCITLIHFFIPLVKVRGNIRSKLAKIDFLGSLLSLGANILVLVPISAGGATYAWNSALVISMLVVGGVMWVAFVLVEWKVARLPVLPLRLFKIRTVGCVMVQTVGVGMVYYGNLFFLPIYFQSLLQMSTILSACYLLSLLLVQTFASVAMGQITMRTGQMKPQIVFGFSVWLIGQGLISLFDGSYGTGDGSGGVGDKRAKIVGYLVVCGIGVGATLQTTLVAAQAAAPAIDRAVVTGMRNFARTLGGAFGLAISSSLLNNILLSSLPSSTPPSLRASISHSAASLDLPADLDPELREGIREAYAGALRDVWRFYVGVVGGCWVLGMGIGGERVPGFEGRGGWGWRRKGNDGEGEVRDVEEEKDGGEEADVDVDVVDGTGINSEEKKADGCVDVEKGGCIAK